MTAAAEEEEALMESESGRDVVVAVAVAVGRGVEKKGLARRATGILGCCRGDGGGERERETALGCSSNF